AGVALVLALLVGPWMAGWFGSDLPRSLFLLVPWSTAVKTSQPRSLEPVTEKPGISSPVASSPAPAVARGTTAATGKASGAPVDGKPGTSGRVTAGGSSTVPPSGAAAPAPTSTPPREAARTGASTDVAAARPGPLAAPPAVYWVQVGAFLDHRNADRLGERLRSEGLPAATTAFEQSRVLYRVLLAGPEGGSVPDDAIERVRGLGHPIETTADGPAVTGPVPLRRAVEMSHTLRQQGVRVRLKQEVSSSTYRVVRVGSFATVAEAEAALASLTAKGVEGIVVRER
ncbi:MAG TPA: SPOR domain-containing protein, partial [Candidatus Thermoplasmatota archaeon]